MLSRAHKKCNIYSDERHKLILKLLMIGTLLNGISILVLCKNSMVAFDLAYEIFIHEQVKFYVPPKL